MRRTSRWFGSVLAAAVATSTLACSDKTRVPRAEAKVQAHASARAARTPRPPPPPPPPPRAADGSYSVAGLRYFEEVTGGARPDDKLPLVVVLHGHGGNPEAFLKSFVGYRGRARLIAPFGFEPSGPGFSWFPVTWHHFNTPAQVPGEIKASDRLATGLAAIAKVRPTTGRFVAAGFSQGGGLSYALALRHPELFSALCPASGQLPTAMFAQSHPTSPFPEVHGFHGDVDTTSDLADTKRTTATFKQIGYVADLKVLHGVGHDFGPARDLVFGCIDKGIAAP